MRTSVLVAICIDVSIYTHRQEWVMCISLFICNPALRFLLPE